MTRFTLYQHVVIYMLIFQYNTVDALLSMNRYGYQFSTLKNRVKSVIIYE